MNGIFGPYSFQEEGEILHWRTECPHYVHDKFIITTYRPEVKNLCMLCAELDLTDRRKAAQNSGIPDEPGTNDNSI